MESQKQFPLVSEIASLSSGQISDRAGESPSCLISSLLMEEIDHQSPEPTRAQEGTVDGLGQRGLRQMAAQQMGQHGAMNMIKDQKIGPVRKG